MLQKFSALLFLSLLATSAFAKPVGEMINFPNENPISMWSMDNESQYFSLERGKPKNVIIYNSERRAMTGLPSDAVHVNCNGKPILVYAGTSFSCYVPVNGTFIVSSEPGSFKNGAEGSFVNLGNFH